MLYNKDIMNRYYLAIPAYNEEQTIGNCLESLEKARKLALPKFNLEKTYICLNGCTDQTKRVVEKYRQKLLELKIEILNSPKGMNRALNKIINSVPNNFYPIIKVDADVLVKEKAFLILLTELEKHPGLQIVGGQPEALPFRGKNFYKKFLTNILDIRSRWPYSQISANDVSEFHRITEIDPQASVPPGFEKKSRIYFHGRFYALKNKIVWDVPEDRIGDDTYLTLSVYKRFGPNSIRIRYDAIVYYQPTVSLIQHWKTYKRIHYDVKTLMTLSNFRALEKIKNLEKVKLDWSYIKTLSVKVQFYFLCYSIIKFIEKLLFKFSSQYSEKLWVYDKKIN